VASYAENCVAAVNRSQADAIRLSAGTHSDRDLGKIVERIRADLELFLKSAVYCGAGRRTVQACIDGLAAMGIAQAHVDALQAVRRGYNSAKHQPGAAQEIEVVRGLLEDLLTAAEAIMAANIGGVGAVEVVQQRRHFWLLAADHFISGETEIDICLPMPDVDFPASLDHVNIDGRSWDDVRAGLEAAGTLREGPSAVPDRVYRVWSGVSDVLFVGSWTGEHRDLLRVLLPHEKIVDVLPGLARGDNLEEALAAMYMAAVDLGADGELANSSASQVRDGLLQHARLGYSIPRDKPAAQRAAELVAAPLSQLDTDQRARLTGPSGGRVVTFGRTVARLGRSPWRGVRPRSLRAGPTRRSRAECDRRSPSPCGAVPANGSPTPTVGPRGLTVRARGIAPLTHRRFLSRS
jgi:hypothetical protein